MATIDDVFSTLTLVYGSRFTSHWPDSAIPEVKRAWEKELQGLPPEALAYGLEHLPAGNPPLALDFRDLCRGYLPQPRVSRVRVHQTPEERERALEILRAFERPGPRDPKDWARKLRARELAGERLTLFQRQCWREALGVPKDAPVSSE